MRAWAALPTLHIAGLRAIVRVNTRDSGFTCEQRTTPDTVAPKTQTTSSLAAHCQRIHRGGLRFGHHTASSRGVIATNRGNYAIQGSDTPATRRQPAPHAAKPHHRHGGHREQGSPAAAPMSDKSPATGPKGNPTSDTKLSPHTHPHRMSGTKLSPLTPSRRTSGTKLSPHTHPHRMSGTKLSPLAQNGSIWHCFCMQGEFCTVLTTKKPSRENYVPNAR